MDNSIPLIRQELRAAVVPEKAVGLARFFKAGPGEYAEGDKFLGITVPQIRKVVAAHRHLPLEEIEELLHSHWHEERLTALLILVYRYQHGNELTKDRAYEFYVANTIFINNWDLVDSSAEFIVGPQLEHSPYKLKVLTKLAEAPLLWERRIAMLATFDYIKKGHADEALIIAEKLLNDKHDLIQKAVGWMLREIGKRVDRALLVTFLDAHAPTMPRTTLRYAIEHFSPEIRAQYLAMKVRTR